MTVERTDLPRLLTVSVAAIICVVGGMWGSGVFGGPSVPETSNGALRDDSTLLAPGGPAFSIWSVIYLGLLVYAVWQWLPANRSALRHRLVGWWIAASMVLNAVWLAVVRLEWIWVSVAVIAALALVLGAALGALARAAVADGTRAGGEGPVGGGGHGVTLADRVVTDGTVGLYLGWASVATCANVTAAFVADGVDPGGRTAEGLAVAVLLLVLFLAALLAAVSGGNLGVGLAVAWGLLWIGVQRLDGTPQSTLVGAVALVVAAGVLALTVLVRVRSGSAVPVRQPA